MMKYIFLLLLLLDRPLCSAQHVFPEKYSGCITDEFALEADTMTARHNTIEFVKQLQSNLAPKINDRIRGTLKLQIIVDAEGNSCLLSIQNETNVKSGKLNLKDFIDRKVKFNVGSKKVAALIILEFHEHGVGYQRLGMNASRGWHLLK